MSLGTPRLKLPSTAKAGEVVTVRALIGHPMESGFRKGPDGLRIPRLIVYRFTAVFEGELVLEADLEPAMAANPYIEFDLVARASGTLRCTWTEDGGAVATAEASLVVT